MRIRYTPKAVADLQAIADYLEPLNPYALKNVKTAILGSLSHVAQFPNIGRLQTKNGVRKYAVRKYKYLIFYTFSEMDDEILVISILHPAQKRPYKDQ